MIDYSFLVYMYVLSNAYLVWKLETRIKHLESKICGNKHD